MDISGISMATMNLSMNKVGAGIGTVLLKKTLDNAEAQGNEMLKLLELSADPDLGANFDAIA